VQSYSREVATSLSARIAKLGPFQLLTDGNELPVFAFTVADDGFSVFDLSAALRESGWLVPAYTFPANREDLAALRVVVRNGFTHDMADLFVADLESCLPRLRAQRAPVRGPEAASFAHGGARHKSR
jgi:glutamate decarboxylase